MGFHSSGQAAARSSPVASRQGSVEGELGTQYCPVSVLFLTLHFEPRLGMLQSLLKIHLLCEQMVAKTKV